MLIKVSDPAFQTGLFSIVFWCLLFAYVGRSKDETFFSKEVTNQLKGLAILAVVFSHIGYFLSSDTKFLFPYSILAGVGVNLFLVLSGFGLTASHLKNPLSPLSFYKKRLSKLFIPLWITVAVILLTDFLVLHRTYTLAEIIHSFLGFYPRADVSQNLDSPLWYFSLIFFYYLIFPFTFVKKLPWLAPFLVLAVSLLVLNLPLPVNPDVLKLYKLHFLAFPLGMFFGLANQKIKFRLSLSLKALAFAVATAVFLYTSIHSGVGSNPKIEQGVSLITAVSLAATFALSGFNFKLLSVFGLYSYEIYLLHWPILSRFNLFLSLPPFLTVLLNLGLIMLLGYGLQKLTEKITKLNRLSTQGS